MHRISWSETARNDLTEIDAWLSSLGNPELALNATIAIRDRCQILAQFPAIGPRVGAIVRKLNVPGWPYVIIYQIVPETVHVLRVRHSRSDWANDP